MGLDMHLYCVEKGRDDSVGESNRVLYWRKSHAIHKWFVGNIQGGNDDCMRYCLPPEKALQLAYLCQSIETEPDKANRLLGDTPEAFFSSGDYDWFRDELAHTAKVLEKKVLTTNFDTHILVYSSSW